MAKANRVAKASPKNTTATKVSRAGSSTKGKQKPVHDELLFDKDNYMWMLIGLGLIVLGFVLMYGKEDIYKDMKITVAPLLVLAGFGVEVYAIMKKKKGEQPITESQAGESEESKEEETYQK